MTNQIRHLEPARRLVRARNIAVATLLVVGSTMWAGSVQSTNAGADTPPSVGTQTDDPSSVRQQWWRILAPAPGIGFSGNVGSCNAGSTAASFRAAELRALNALRALAGVAPVTENTSWSATAQQTALLMAANQSLSHSPPANWTCYTQTAADGAAHSNLYLGVNGPEAMAGYVADGGAGNDIVGHRRWLLCPGSTEVGFGDVPAGSNAPFASNATKVFDSSSVSDGPSRESFVAWPNPGIVPLAYADAAGLLDRFSVQVPTTLSTASATVTITSNTRGSIPISSVHRDDDLYCEPAVVFVPQLKPNPGETWTISISGLEPVSGQGPSVDDTYATTFSSLSIFTTFVQAAYLDFLGRAPNSAETSFWQNRLDQDLLNGTVDQGRSELVTTLSLSSEWIAHVIHDFYTDTLQRAPDPGGLAYWTAQLSTGRLSVASVAASFYSSSEYYQDSGGTDAGWINSLYLALLHRSSNSTEQNYWSGQIALRGRLFVAAAVYQSLESRNDRVTNLYEELLGRAPDGAGRSYWAGIITRSGDLALAASLAASNEYLERSFSRF